MDLHPENREITLPQLTTARLVLRRMVAGDATAIMAAMGDWDLVKWLSAPPHPYSRVDADWFIANCADEVWAIDAGNGLIGTIGVKPDLGYWLSPALHGQGLMQEAVTAVVNWYFTHHDTALVSGHFVGNDPSRAVLLKRGFVDTHLTTQFSTPMQKQVPLQRMELTSDRWQTVSRQSS